MVASSSMCVSVSRGKPPENKTSILRPGTPHRLRASVRTESSMLRAPNCASALNMEENGEELPLVPKGLVPDESADEATSTGLRIGIDGGGLHAIHRRL